MYAYGNFERLRLRVDAYQRKPDDNICRKHQRHQTDRPDRIIIPLFLRYIIMSTSCRF